MCVCKNHTSDKPGNSVRFTVDWSHFDGESFETGEKYEKKRERERACMCVCVCVYVGNETMTEKSTRVTRDRRKSRSRMPEPLCKRYYRWLCTGKVNSHLGTQQPAESGSTETHSKGRPSPPMLLASAPNSPTDNNCKCTRTPRATIITYFPGWFWLSGAKPLRAPPAWNARVFPFGLLYLRRCGGTPLAWSKTTPLFCPPRIPVAWLRFHRSNDLNNDCYRNAAGFSVSLHPAEIPKDVETSC